MFVGIFALVLLFGAPALAVEKLRVLALFKDKAILEVDGTRRVLAKDQVSPEGVKLLSANSDEAVVEINGRREVLQLSVMVGRAAPTETAQVTLYANGAFFYADGSINGQAVRFLVDTGANTVALNSALARRLGIDYTKGQAGVATTASGYARVYGIKLRTVKIGDIVLHDVDAGVIDGPQPEYPLLGMSFLGALEMRRDGDRMDLIKKY